MLQTCWPMMLKYLMGDLKKHGIHMHTPVDARGQQRTTTCSKVLDFRSLNVRLLRTSKLPNLGKRRFPVCGSSAARIAFLPTSAVWIRTRRTFWANASVELWGPRVGRTPSSEASLHALSSRIREASSCSKPTNDSFTGNNCLSSWLVMPKVANDGHN